MIYTNKMQFCGVKKSGAEFSNANFYTLVPSTIWDVKIISKFMLVQQEASKSLTAFELLNYNILNQILP